MSAPVLSRQRQWQAARRAEGRCTICAEPAANGGTSVLCIGCLEKRRARSLAYARKKAGIPLDRPLSNKGRKRFVA